MNLWSITKLVVVGHCICMAVTSLNYIINILVKMKFINHSLISYIVVNHSFIVQILTP